jgi:predicted DNA-binding protein (UPF0251 family)
MKEAEVIELLKQYSVCKRFLDSQAYAKEYFNPYDTQKIDEKEQYEGKMHVIESLIQFLAPSDEYTILRLHYIKGLPIEKCSESMYISRRTGYRLLKKAHKSLYYLLVRKERTYDERN